MEYCELFETSAFTARVGKYLSDDEYARLQWNLMQDPTRGQVIPGTGGIRKIRFEERSRQTGRRGGLRIIYYYFRRPGQIWLMAIYSKGEVPDLTAEQKRQLRAALLSEEQMRASSRRVER